MEAVFVVLLLMTPGLSHGQIHCDARQNGTQCFGALGGTVDLRLVDRIETDPFYSLWTELEYEFYKHSDKEAGLVFRFRKKFRTSYKYQNRSSFNGSSGTFEMSDITRSDEAQYVFYMFESYSGKLQTKLLHLSVQAPVSPPKLSSECLSRGQRRLSCSCDGDSVQYSWTLDGQPLRDEHLFSGGRQDTQNITLTQGLSGVLACDVSNNVSSNITVDYIKPCPGCLISCITPNGTHIPPQWVSTDHDPRCTSLTAGPFVYFQMAELCVLLATCVGCCCVYVYFKMAKRRSSAQQEEPQEESLYCNTDVKETQ